ncbi:DNA-directed RNA polymerase subunit omega [Verrucomicrobiota bacterium]
MNTELVTAAKERVPNLPVLINMVSKRVRQLNAGFRPYVKPKNLNEDKLDIALREIAEGKLTAEIDFTAHLKEEDTAAL